MTYAEKNWGDCSKAVAFKLNFVQMCYGYPSDCYDDYYQLCQKCQNGIYQSKDYEYPKAHFSKKDYYILDTYNFGVSENMRQDMLDFGVSENNFRPIYTRKHDTVLGYQITPIHKIPPIYMNNGGKEIFCCDHCKIKKYEYDESWFEAYNRLGYPEYISEEAFEQLQSINGIMNEVSAETVIISIDLYNYLLKKYPRLECRPVFLGNFKQDKEYIRIHNLK